MTDTSRAMEPLRHGYTNSTTGDGRIVRKSYQGPEAAARLTRERGLLARLRGQLPVPPVVAAAEGVLTLGFLPGTQGQELLDAGRAPEVLAACGALLRRVHAVDLGRTDGRVLVHGDFGPNNVLFDPLDCTVTALLDWEFAHLGSPLEDLAWCEWIVRTHHPDRLDAMLHFYQGYGTPAPPWPLRRAVMAANCRAMEDFCERWEPGGEGAAQWRRRTATTAGWAE